MSRARICIHLVGVLMSLVWALAPLAVGRAQEGVPTSVNEAEWGEASKAPGAETVIADGSEEAATSTESADTVAVPADLAEAHDPALLWKEWGEDSKRAIENPEDQAALPFEQGLFLPLTPKSTGEAGQASAAAADAVDSVDAVDAVSAVPASRSASGDFDGNGVADLAVGVPFEDILSGGVQRTNAGAVHVFYGVNEGGLDVLGTDFWTQDSAGMPGVAEAFDDFGFALVAGNFNGDQYDDLAIGVPFEDFAVVDDGVIHVLLGSATGLTTVGTQLFGQSFPETNEVGDHFGYVLTSGNFDGNVRVIGAIARPVDDLAIGIPDENSVAADCGAVQVLYGTAAGLTAAGNDVWRQGVGGILEACAAGDRFGLTLAAGRFNDGIFYDLAVGVPNEDLIPVNVGVVQIIYGAVGGLNAAGNQLWSQNSVGIADVAEANDFFGSALAAGDFNNDNRADLAIGVPNEDSALADIGVVHVLYGAAAALGFAGSQLWSQDTIGILDLAQAGDLFGFALVARDFNGDIRADLAIGVPFEDTFAVNDGLVHIINGVGAAGLGAAGNDVWYQSKFGILDTSEPGDLFGRSLAAGDFDRNGASDLSIGTPTEDLGVAASKVDAGQINVIYGLSGPGLLSVGDQIWNQDSLGVPDIAEAGDQFAFEQ